MITSVICLPRPALGASRRRLPMQRTLADLYERSGRPARGRGAILLQPSPMARRSRAILDLLGRPSRLFTQTTKRIDRGVFSEVHIQHSASVRDPPACCASGGGPLLRRGALYRIIASPLIGRVTFVYRFGYGVKLLDANTQDSVQPRPLFLPLFTEPRRTLQCHFQAEHRVGNALLASTGASPL